MNAFPQVDHGQVTGELAGVYEDIHATLRIPWVAFAIRVMALFPAYVPAAWTALKPQISTRFAEAGADLGRAAAIVPGRRRPIRAPNCTKPDGPTTRFGVVQHALDALNYGNPKYLILITAWTEAWHERSAGGPEHVLSESDAELLPYGLPTGVDKFSLLDPETASTEVQELLRRVRDLFLHHGPASDYRVLAAWPDYLSIAIADSLAPVALTPQFDATISSNSRARA